MLTVDLRKISQSLGILTAPSDLVVREISMYISFLWDIYPGTSA